MQQKKITEDRPAERATTTEERFTEVLQKLHEEYTALQQRLTFVKESIGAFAYVQNGTLDESRQLISDKPRRYLTAKARKAIAKAQRARWAKHKAHANGNGASNGASNSTANGNTGRMKNAEAPNWTTQEDKRIINLITKKGPVDAAEVSRVLSKKLEKRTYGAVRQRIIRLAKRGLIAEKKGEGLTHIVEAV